MSFDLNLPARLDVSTLDITEIWVCSGLLTADRNRAAETIATLRGSDFENVALETVARGVDRTIRDGQPVSPATVTESAVRHGLIRRDHEVEFERLIYDVLADGFGDLGLFWAPALTFRSSIRSLLEISTRAEQIRERYEVVGGWWMGDCGQLADAGGMIAEAEELATILDALAQQLHEAADRLRAEVAPRDEFIGRRLATRPGTRLIREAVSA